MDSAKAEPAVEGRTKRPRRTKAARPRYGCQAHGYDYEWATPISRIRTVSVTLIEIKATNNAGQA